MYTEGELKPIRYTSESHEDLMTEMNIKLTFDEKTTIRIENEHGFDLTVDKLVKGGRR